MPELEIHCINVSQGDSTLIINRDVDKIGKNIDAAIKKTPTLGAKPVNSEDLLPFAVAKDISLVGTIRMCMLIDAGDDIYGDDVAKYLKAQGVDAKTEFYTLATHYHADHVGGFYAVFYSNFDTKKTLANQVVNLAPKSAYDCGDLLKWDNTSTKTTYKSYIDDLKRRGLTKEDTFSFKQGQYHLGYDKNGVCINLTAVAGNGSIADHGKSIPKQVIDPNKSADQNARSVTLILEYGEFRCFLGGDIGGNGVEAGGNFGVNKDTRAKKFYSTYADIEAQMTSILPKVIQKAPKRLNTAAGHICLHSANHHGSSSSNDTFFIETMQPRVVFCSAGIKASFHCHPTQEFFQRIDKATGYSPKWQDPGDTTKANPTQVNTIDGYYITEMAVDGKYSAKQYQRKLVTGKILGDIIIRPIGQVDASKAGFVNKVDIQVYGTGMLSDPSLSSIPLRKTETVKPAATYPIGPFIHTCNKH